ncbi:hypothetical protein CR513_17048, partial [Mucuna pruriens]
MKNKSIMSMSKRGEGKEDLVVSRKDVKRVLLVRKKSLFLLPTYMCFHVSSPLSNLPIGLGEMLEDFKDLFPEDILKALPSIRGIKHYIDFTLVAYRANPKESKEIQ